ncbi:hypothetical protein JTB14_035329 [Gonioctena quinquepunctata]|nr:hypothetical protein JTB14_035329 [Gonioctena quinquepunctata]
MVDDRFQSKINNLRGTRESVSGAIWKQIAATVGQFVSQTDLRRSHLAELKRLDAESAAEIAVNEERIRREKISIDNLEEECTSVQAVQEMRQNCLVVELAVLNKSFSKIRKHLQSDLQIDEKKIKLLTDESCKALNYLKG